MIEYGKQMEKSTAEIRAKTEPDATSVQLGVDLLTGVLWDVAIQRAQGAMEVRKLRDKSQGLSMNNPTSAYRVTEQHVVRAYEGLVSEMDLPTKLLAYRGKLVPQVLVEELLGQERVVDYGKLINQDPNIK